MGRIQLPSPSVVVCRSFPLSPLAQLPAEYYAWTEPRQVVIGSASAGSSTARGPWRDVCPAAPSNRFQAGRGLREGSVALGSAATFSALHKGKPGRSRAQLGLPELAGSQAAPGRQAAACEPRGVRFLCLKFVWLCLLPRKSVRLFLTLAFALRSKVAMLHSFHCYPDFAGITRRLADGSLGEAQHPIPLGCPALSATLTGGPGGHQLLVFSIESCSRPCSITMGLITRHWLMIAEEVTTPAFRSSLHLLFVRLFICSASAYQGIKAGILPMLAKAARCFRVPARWTIQDSGSLAAQMSSARHALPLMNAWKDLVIHSKGCGGNAL